MLKQIAINGTEAQKRVAVKNMVASSRMRGQRQDARELLSLSRTLVSDIKRRTVYNAQQGNSLPGILVRLEGDPPVLDPAVNEAYDFSGATYDLFKTVYNRNSIDDNGMKLDSTVHYQKGYDNAFWNGNQMVYGDGDEDLPPDQQLFNRFTKAIDVVGHELAHGVTQFEANLTYFQQSGALNESFSDVFGSLVKQYHLQQMAVDADWIIGEGLFTANVSGKGIRSMKALELLTMIRYWVKILNQIIWMITSTRAATTEASILIQGFPTMLSMSRLLKLEDTLGRKQALSGIAH